MTRAICLAAVFLAADAFAQSSLPTCCDAAGTALMRALRAIGIAQGVTVELNGKVYQLETVEVTFDARRNPTVLVKLRPVR